STWHRLADLEVRMRKYDRWVVAVADVRKAFDNVPISTVVELHTQALDRLKQKTFSAADKHRTVALVETVLRGRDEHKTRGIDQGGPFSPSALNVLFHYQLDVPITARVGTKPCWFRYADNLVCLGQNVSEGGQVLDRVSQLLQPLGPTGAECYGALRKAASASANSRAEPYRSAASFARHFRQIRSRPGGTAPLRERTGGGFSRRMRWR